MELFLDVAGEAAAAVIILEAGEEGVQMLADEGVEGVRGLVQA